MMASIWIGYDPREAEAFSVTRMSIVRRLTQPIPVHSLVLDDLRERGLYRRPTSVRNGRLWDDISEAPMATEFAISRFLVPKMARKGWALFMDCDMLVRESLARLFECADPKYAVMCVKHRHEPVGITKMDNQVQTSYPRKNWSSVMLFNCDHDANKIVMASNIVNDVPGRDLHRFCWLRDDEIGELDESWNWLSGHSDEAVTPKIVHFTDGVPSLPGYENSPYAEEWRQERARWAA